MTEATVFWVITAIFLTGTSAAITSFFHAWRTDERLERIESLLEELLAYIESLLADKTDGEVELPVSRVARHLGVSESTVRRMCRDSVLAGRKSSAWGQWVVLRSEVDRYKTETKESA